MALIALGRTPPAGDAGPAALKLTKARFVPPETGAEAAKRHSR